MKVKALALSLLIVLIAVLEIPTAMASPDIYLKDSPASGVTVNPGKLMDFEAPTRVDPAYLTTSNGIEYYWYSPPYVGTIPGPKAHSFHLYYTADALTTITVTVYVAVQPDGSGTPAQVSSKTFPLEVTSTVMHIKIPDVIVIPETKLNGEKIKLSLSTEEPITVYYDSTATPSVLNVIPWPPPPAPAPATALWWDPFVDVNDIALSKDGQYVAAVTIAFSGEVRFYNRTSVTPKTPMWTWTTGESLYSVAISADGDCVAAGNKTIVYFWKNARSLIGPSNPTWTSVLLPGSIGYRCLAISDDGDYLVVAGGTQVSYWKDAKGNSGPNISPTWLYSFTSSVQAVDLSSDGNYVAAGFGKRVAYWKNAKTTAGHPDWVSPDQIDYVVDVAVSDDGNYVAAAATTETVYYWAGAKDLTANPPPTWSSGAGISFTSIDMSSDGGSVVAGAGGTNRGVYFWGGARGLSGMAAWTWRYATEADVHDVAINAAGDYMAAANDVFAPRVYFFDNGGDLKWSYLLDGEAFVLSISSDGGTLAVGTIGGPGTPYLFDTGYRTPIARPVGGLLLPADKLALLSPWIVVALAAVALTVFAAKRRKR